MADIKFPSEAPPLSVVTLDTPLLTSAGNTINSVTVDQIADIASERVTVDGGSIPAIQGGSTSATAVALPTLGDENRYFDTSSGYWKYNDVVLVNPNGVEGIPSGSDGIVYWNGTTKLWSITKVQVLPINPADGLVKLGETKAPNGDKVYKAIQPINDYITGVSNFGVVDNTGYVVANPTEYTRINTLSANAIDGILDRIKVRVSKVGSLKIIFCSKISETSYKIEKLIPVTATVVGNNDFINEVDFENIEIKAGWYEGFIVPTGGALPTNITKTGGSVSLGTNTSVEGNTITVGGSNTEWAIGAYIKSGSLDEKITSKIGLSDLTIVSSENLAKETLFRDGVYINATSGAKVFVAGWGTYRIPVPLGVPNISFGNFQITTSGYSAFYGIAEDPALAGATNMVQYNGIHSDLTLPKTVDVPQSIQDNGGWLYITVKRPTDTRSKSEQTMVNTGAVLLPYAPAEVITSITGIPLAGQNSEVIGIGNERMEYRSNRKATFSFIFDDLNTTDALVYNIFKEYGFRPSFALKTANLNSSNSKEYIDYFNDGCSILAHSVTHPSMSNPANITYQQVTDEMVNSKKAIKALGIVVSGWVTPQSVLSIDFLPIADKVFGYGFTNLNAGQFNTSVHPNRQARFSIEGTEIIGNSLQMVKDRIDLAITNGELINFYAHKLPSTSLDVNGDSYLTETKLRAILTYIKSKYDSDDCLVLNTDDAVKTYYTQTYSEKFQ